MQWCLRWRPFTHILTVWRRRYSRAIVEVTNHLGPKLRHGFDLCYVKRFFWWEFPRRQRDCLDRKILLVLIVLSLKWFSWVPFRSRKNWLAIFTIGIFIHFINGWLKIVVSTFSCFIKLYRFRENMRDLRSVCPSREWISVLDVKLYIYRIQFKWGRNVPFTRP